ncbi:MAG: YciI family protein [Rhodothalassiaceae bacterium]
MLFVIIGRDKPGVSALRAQTRERHLAYLRDAGDRLKLAGPLRDSDDLDAPAGTLLVVEAASLSAARLMAENDPYMQAGVFAEVEVKPFKAMLGQWA